MFVAYVARKRAQERSSDVVRALTAENTELKLKLERIESELQWAAHALAEIAGSDTSKLPAWMDDFEVWAKSRAQFALSKMSVR